ncbi:uncharacterized protein LOC135193517 [Vanessa tameamea]|uniref:Uncharacterized protein LOC135193517 n=1 Tax=Vanessa tameamea TaxID=334116 RepID=A0ABM4AM74_VANTA
MINRDDQVTTKLLMLIIDFERHLEVFAFCVFIAVLIDRLSIINTYLEQYIFNKKNKTFLNVITRPKDMMSMQKNYVYINYTPQNIKITLLAKAYAVIGETNELINKVFQFHIFKSLTSTFIYIIIIIWTSIYYLRISNNTEFLIRIILFCIFEIMSIGIMSYVCESILLKRNSIKILVNELIMDYDLNSPALRIEAKAFTDVIQVWPLHIFVYDMFSIDIKLIVKFISVSTTYLIIIVQLSHFF